MTKYEKLMLSLMVHLVMMELKKAKRGDAVHRVFTQMVERTVKDAEQAILE
jgi:hypothetical protein